MLRKAFAFAVLCCISSVALAAPTLSIGNYVFSAGPNQKIEIYASGITGADQFNGMVINLYSPAPGPVIQSLDAITGTLFAPNHNAQTDYGDTPLPGHIGVASITTNSGFITQDGLVATAMLDTTGLAPGSVWAISLFDARPLDGYENSYLTGTSLQDSFETIMIDGTVTIVPEPSSVVLGLFAASGIAAVVIRKRRARKTA